MVELINIFQGGMSVPEYSLKFNQFSKYAPSLVSHPRVEMNRLVTGVSDDFQQECHLDTLHNNIFSWFKLKKLKRHGLRGRS